MQKLDCLIKSVEESGLRGALRNSQIPQMHSLIVSDLKTPLPLHISLSSSLVLRTEEKDDFLQAISSVLVGCTIDPRRNLESSDETCRCFSVNFSGVDWVANAERTRWFLALRVEKPGGNELNRLLGACNTVARARGLPTLYEKSDSPTTPLRNTVKKRKMANGQAERDGTVDPQDNSMIDFTDRFHFSIAWSLNAPIGLSDAVSPAAAGGPILNETLKLKASFNEVKVKIGNTVRSLPFSTPKCGTEGSKGILF